MCSDCLLGVGGAKKRGGEAKKQETRGAGGSFALARRYPACTNLHKSVSSLHKSVSYNRKSVDRITARARHTDTPGFQGQDGRSLGRDHSGKKNMARYAEKVEEGKNKGYCCGQADMCLAQPVQNTDTDEQIIAGQLN